MANRKDGKKPVTVPGLDDLLGLSENSVADLAELRRLNNLKIQNELTDEQLSAGFKNLLALRREVQPKSKPLLRRWASVAAAIPIIAFIGVWMLWLRQTQVNIITYSSGSRMPNSVEIASAQDNEIVKARVEGLDLRLRGVTGLAAKSNADILTVSLQSGFLEAEYHAEMNRKKLAILAGDTQFTVVGTRFFIQMAGDEVRLVVTHGKVGIKRLGYTYEVGEGSMWSNRTGKVLRLSPIQIGAYQEKFETVNLALSEIDPAEDQAEVIATHKKSRVKVSLKLGQVISGSLIREDDEAVMLKTNQGRELRIVRSEITKIERAP